MKNLLWFHAFSRPTVVDVIKVFRNGPRHHPDPTTTTRRNEATLGIDSSVYTYLGKTVPDFGNVAFALPLDAVNGEMSPFDTGGLVRHIAPVNSWDQEERRAYLQAFTWPTAERDARLKTYPSPSRPSLKAYLEGRRPSTYSGPHDLWRSAHVAAIWSDPANSWQAWTWEARTRGSMPKPTALRAWSCSPALHRQIQEYAATSRRKTDTTFIAALERTYIRGGVSRLVAVLREEQAV